MSNIHVIRAKNEPVQEVVDAAKDLLRRAEAGEITDLAWCASEYDGAIGTGFTPTSDQLKRIASVSRLLHRLHVNIDG